MYVLICRYCFLADNLEISICCHLVQSEFRAENTNFISASIDLFTSKHHEFNLKLQHFHALQSTRTRQSLSTFDSRDMCVPVKKFISRVSTLTISTSFVYLDLVHVKRRLMGIVLCPNSSLHYLFTCPLLYPVYFSPNMVLF